MSFAGPKFETIDALRGVAAIGVLAFHEPFAGRAVMPGGYLAVDLFFLMSGFIIAHAYAARLAGGMTLRGFLYARAIRLWPMLALGAMLGIALHGGHAASLFLVPDWRSPANLFPANPPLWSLLFEVLAYVGFALGGWRLGTRALAGVVAASLLALAALSQTQGPISEFGAHWQTLAGGSARITFGFATGMLLYRFWQKNPPARRSTPLAWLLPLALVFAMVLLPPDAGWPALAIMILVLPTVVWLSLTWQVPQGAIAERLGALSYPLYCIHVPLIAFTAHDILSALFTLALLPLAALAIDRFADRPARAALCRWLEHGEGPGRQTRIGIST